MQHRASLQITSGPASCQTSSDLVVVLLGQSTGAKVVLSLHLVRHFLLATVHFVPLNWRVVHGKEVMKTFVTTKF